MWSLFFNLEVTKLSPLGTLNGYGVSAQFVCTWMCVMIKVNNKDQVCYSGIYNTTLTHANKVTYTPLCTNGQRIVGGDWQGPSSTSHMSAQVLLHISSKYLCKAYLRIKHGTRVKSRSQPGKTVVHILYLEIFTLW